jgi:hypothetical protein
MKSRSLLMCFLFQFLPGRNVQFVCVLILSQSSLHDGHSFYPFDPTTSRESFPFRFVQSFESPHFLPQGLRRMMLNEIRIEISEQSNGVPSSAS